MKEWNFYIDTGGTFTDCLGLEVGGVFQRIKVLSRGSLTARVVKQISATEILLDKDVQWPNSFPVGFTLKLGPNDTKIGQVLEWNNRKKIIRCTKILKCTALKGKTLELFSGWEAPLLGMRLILANSNTKEEDCLIRMRLATTRCTNALLEKKGIKPVLFITKGFANLLDIGDQRRVDLFDPIPRKRKSFAGQSVEVEERTNQMGQVEEEPDLDQVRRTGKALLKDGHSLAVISLKNSFKNFENEQKIARELGELGFQTIIRSEEIYPFIKWLPRTEAAILEGYLHQVLQGYLRNIKLGLGENGQLLVMNSSGGLIDSDDYRAIDSLLSGPAGGVVGAATVARRAGLNKIINLDMGGTSTDVSRFSDDYSFRSSLQVGEACLAGICLNIETVAAGGGSVCKFEKGRLLVGPESAGAYPGPSCYGFGGPFCLTDVNLLLDRLDSTQFPTPISKSCSERKLDQLIKKTGFSKDDLLNGFIDVANEEMARAIRKISIEDGYDPREHTLVSFGGAGGQHICGVANRLGIKKILSPGDSGLLSAYGLSMARIERVVEKALKSIHGPK